MYLNENPETGWEDAVFAVVTMIVVVGAIVVVIAVMHSFLSSAPPPDTLPRSFKQLIENRVEYAQEYWGHPYADGVVVWVDEEKHDFFVATYNPPPEANEELAENEFIVVKAPVSDIQIGDIIELSGPVKLAKGEQDGQAYEVYYLDAHRGTLSKTGHVDLEDPDFDDLVQIVRQKVAAQEFARTWWMIWYYGILIPRMFFF